MWLLKKSKSTLPASSDEYWCFLSTVTIFKWMMTFGTWNSVNRQENEDAANQGHHAKDDPVHLPVSEKLLNVNGLLPDTESWSTRYKIVMVQWLWWRNGSRKFDWMGTMKRKRHLTRPVSSNIDPSLPTYIRLPGNPIPRSWAFTIMKMQPLQQDLPPLPGSRTLQIPSILDADLTTFGNDYAAVYMDPPLLLPGEEPSPGKITFEEFVSETPPFPLSSSYPLY